DKLAVGISGVKDIVLRSDVDMRLFVDSRSNFLGTPRPTAPPKPHDEKSGATPSKENAAPSAPATPPAPASKDLVHIETQGRFHYDLITDQAHFNIPQNPRPRPTRGEVRRRPGPHGRDQLDCEPLVMHFHRKTHADTPAAPAKEPNSVELEIETAH